MPKPYSILAAALVASGHSLSTATIAASIDRRANRPSEESEDRFPGPEPSRPLNFDSPFAINPFAERVPANTPALAA